LGTKKKWSKFVEIIGRNYGVQLEDISGIRAGAFRKLMSVKQTLQLHRRDL